jgi:hypothetical protein
MKLVLDLTTVEPISGSLVNPETGAAMPIAGWMSLMSAISDLAREPTPARIPTSTDNPPNTVNGWPSDR